MLIKAGTSDISTIIRFLDATSGTPASQVVSTTTGLDMWYRRDGALKTLLSPINLAAANSAHSDGGIIHVQDGYYRVDLPDAAVGSEANGVLVGGSATGFTAVGTYVQLIGYDPQTDLTTTDINKLNDIDGKAASANVPDIISLANIRAEASGALNTYDPPTNAEMEARTLVAATYFEPAVDRVILTTATASQIDNIANNTSALSDSRIPNVLSLNNISTQATESLSAIGLQFLLNSAVAGANVIDNSVFAKIVSASAQADWDTFDNTTDSLEVVAGTAGLNTSQVRQQMDEGLSAIGLDHLLSAAVVGADIADNSVFAKLTSSSAQADWDTFVNTTESLQALRNRGDAAWITATGFSTFDNTIDTVILQGATASQINRIEINASALSDSKIPNVLSLANIRAESSGALNTYDAPTNAEMEARTLVAANYFDPATDRIILTTATASQIDNIANNTSALSDSRIPDIISLNNISTQATESLSAIGLQFLLNSAVVGANVIDNSIFAKIVSASAQADWDTFDNTTDSLEALAGAIGLNTSQVRQQVDEGLSAIGLDHLLSQPVVGAEVTDNSVFAKIVSGSAQADWDTFNNTTDSLEIIAGAAGLTTSQVRQQMDEGLSAIGLDHLVSVSVAGVDVTDNSIFAKIVSASAQADWDTFINTDDSLQAISESGGGGLTTSQIRTQVDEGLSAIGLDHLLSVAVAGADVMDNSVVAKITSSSAQADWDTFINTTESLQAIRDRGDVAWITATGFSTFDNTTDTVILQGATASQLNRIETNASALSDSKVPNILSLANIRAEASGALDVYDAPTSTEFNDRTLASANYFDFSTDRVILTTATASQVDNIANNTSALSDSRVPDIISLNNIGAQSTESLSAIGLQYLVNTAVAGANVVDNSIFAKVVSASAQADWDTFVNTTDALEAIRNRGDAAWVTAAGFSTFDPSTDRILLNTGAASQLDRIETNASSLSDSKIPNVLSLANIRNEASGALNTYDSPTNAEMEARTLVAANYFDPAADRVILTTATASQINNIANNASALSDSRIPDILSLANVRAEASGALNVYDAPTNTEMNARTILASEYATSALIPSLSAGLMPGTIQAIDGSASAAQRLRLSTLTITPGTATTHQLSTTQMSTNVAEATDDHFNGRIIIWTSGALKDQATDITDYAGHNGTSSLFTFTAITEAPANGNTFIVI